MCSDCVCTYREDQDELETSVLAGTLTGHSQKPMMLEHNSLYFTVDDTQQHLLALSSNPAYNIVSRDSQELVQEDNPDYFTVSRSVVSL